MPLLRMIACVLPLQIATLLGFTWYATRPPAHKHVKPAVYAPRRDVEQADRLVMVKHTHTLTLLRGDKVLGTYYAMTGRVAGAKEFAGDLKTPEGTYFVDERKTVSCCHLALHLSYPSPEDVARAAAAHQQPGINIEIHGLPRHAPAAFDPAHPLVIGTHGCIEVSNEDMDVIFARVPLGTPVEISP